MALTVVDSNTTTTDGTSQSLSAQTPAGVYVFAIDTNAMADADELLIQMQMKVLTGGTVRTLWRATVGPSARAEKIVESPPVVGPFGCTVKIQRLAGTDRAYDWSLMTL
jgi:hypothetical protein